MYFELVQNFDESAAWQLSWKWQKYSHREVNYLRQNYWHLIQNLHISLRYDFEKCKKCAEKSCKVAKIDFGFEGGYNNVKNKIYIRLFNIKLPALSSHLCQPYLYSLKLIYSPLFAIVMPNFLDMMRHDGVCNADQPPFFVMQITAFVEMIDFPSSNLLTYIMYFLTKIHAASFSDFPK